MLKKMTYAMLVSGLLLASFGASADSPFPDQSREIDYGVRIASSPFPDQSDSIDHGIRVAKADTRSPFPDQSNSTDYGIRVGV
jgi:hypothetical protein